MTFIEQIAASDVTDDDINRLQVELLYGRILKSPVRVEASRTLGVLREVLAEARRMAAQPTPDPLVTERSGVDQS